MDTDYADVVAALEERFEEVAQLKVRLTGAPKELQDAPAIYTLFEAVSSSRQGQLSTRTYRSLHRVCVRWQDNAQAEQELIALVDAVLNVLESDLHLGGTNMLIKAISDARGGWAMISKVEHRVIDFYTDVLVKQPFVSS